MLYSLRGRGVTRFKIIALYFPNFAMGVEGSFLGRVTRG